jgi:hypothetical protein
MTDQERRARAVEVVTKLLILLDRELVCGLMERSDPEIEKVFAEISNISARNLFLHSSPEMLDRLLAAARKTYGRANKAACRRKK